MKHISTRILIAVLFIMAILSGYNYFQKPFLARFEEMEQELESLETTPSQDPIQAAVDELSPREKILQTISFPLVLGDEASESAEVAWVQSNQPGFITLFGNDISAADASRVIQLSQSGEGLKPLAAVDHEGGLVQRLNGEGFSLLPSWRNSCLLSSEEREVIFTQSAQELSQAGVQIVFAPDVDIAREGSFLGTRACQTEASVVDTATDYITSFAQYGILPVIKHFPGIGSADSDLHFQLDTIELEAEDARVFDRLLTAFPNIGVMTTHVVVAGRTNGIPCSLSPVCSSRFFTYFPEVILFADALEMRSASLEEGIETPKSLTEVATQAVLAGNDVLIFGETVDIEQIEEVLDVLEAKYATNEGLQQQIDASVTKIIKLKLPPLASEEE